MPAPTPETASFVVELDYGVDQGQQKVVTYPGTGFGYGSGLGYGRGFGFGGFGYGGFYRPYYSRFGCFGPGYHPFYSGWNDAVWGSSLDYP